MAPDSPLNRKATPTRRHLGRVALWVLAVPVALVSVVVGGAFVAMSAIESPLYAWRVLAYGQSDTNDWQVFPERPIAAAAIPSSLPVAVGGVPELVNYPYGGALKTEPLAQLLDRTDTKAFIVVWNDRIVLEAYPNSTRDAVNTSFSTAKSIDSALIGAAIADGLIGSVDDPVIKYLPEIKGRGIDALTIRDLLMMNTGIRYVPNEELPFYMAPFGDDARTYYSADMRRLALSVEAGPAPIGKAFRYNKVHPLLEGLILERVTGMSVSKYLERRIWQPMGAEFSATWSLDSEQFGFEKMESGLNVRAIDFARFGEIFLHNGLWNGHQILPREWVAQSTAPADPDPREWQTFPNWPKVGGYYGYHWWGLTNSDGSYDFMARGQYDQLIYVAPRKNVVVVRMGNQPDPAVDWGRIVQKMVDALG